MRIALGRRGDYAVRAVLHLARHHGSERRKSRQIAVDMNIPEKYLPQVLADLVRAGVITSLAGPDGGYALARPPGQITLLEVVEIAEGRLESAECIIRGGPCRWEDRCALHASWAAAKEAFTNQLGTIIFADLARADEELDAGSAAAKDR
jgi:Rrf2 family protein